MSRRLRDMETLRIALTGDPEMHTMSSLQLAGRLGLGRHFVEAHRWEFQPRVDLVDSRGRRVGAKPARARQRPAAPRTPMAARRSGRRKATPEEIRDAELELRKEFDNKVAAFRMREVRGTWTNIATDALCAIASVVTSEAAAELATRGYAVVDIGGERTVIAPPENCIPLILRVTSIAEEVDEEATEIAHRRPIKDVDALLRKRIVEAVREGEL